MQTKSQLNQLHISSGGGHENLVSREEVEEALIKYHVYHFGQVKDISLSNNVLSDQLELSANNATKSLTKR